VSPRDKIAWREGAILTEKTHFAPKHGWVCFHCGEQFANPNLARAHFGYDQRCKPACVLIQERGMLYELRQHEERHQIMLDRALRAEEEVDVLQGQLAELKRITGCDGVHEARCELDSLRGRVAVYDLITDKFRELSPGLFAEVIG